MSDVAALPRAAMPDVVAPHPQVDADGAEAPAIRKHIRGSSVLLVGRVISVLLNFAVQVVSVRYLSKSDYGAFAYGLGVGTLCAAFVLAGLAKSVPRFVTIYYEKRDYPRAFGTIAVAVSVVVGLGWSLVALVIGLRGVLAGRLVTDPQALSLLLILIALAPINALDTLLQQVVSVFASPRAIFVRRHLLGPALKLAAVLVVVVTRGSVRMLAYGFVITAAVGVWLYAIVLVNEWRKRGVLHHLNPRRLEWPLRELIGFSAPLLVSEVSNIARVSLAVILLEHFRATADVAEYRAVLAIAGLNTLVFEAFAFLYTPVASRMFARDDRGGIGNLYWHTAQWITVLTFPIFVVTAALAGPLTVLLFGARYANAAPLLSILALGYYVNAALGFNATTLLVRGQVRLVLLGEVAAACAAVGLNLLLIPRYGSLGAAISTAAALLLLNVIHSVCLGMGRLAVRPLDRHFTQIYALAIGMAGALLLFQQVVAPPFWVGLGCATVVSVVILRIARHSLKPDAAFPELLRIPLVGRMIS